MVATKKEQGNAVEIILETAKEMWRCVGEDTIREIVNLLNAAYMICAMWDLHDSDKIEKYVDLLNMTLDVDKSKTRIIFDDLTYKLAELV